MLTENQKKTLREIVNNTCESCKKEEKEVGTLQVHRMKRGNMGGKYVPHNIKMICSKCHKQIHYNEF